MVARPQQQAAVTAAARWQRPPATVKAGKGTLCVRHGVAKVVVRAVERGEGHRRGGMELGWLDNGGHGHGGVRAREQGQRGG
jgi:hypothetical protein